MSILDRILDTLVGKVLFYALLVVVGFLILAAGFYFIFWPMKLMEIAEKKNWQLPGWFYRKSGLIQFVWVLILLGVCYLIMK